MSAVLPSGTGGDIVSTVVHQVMADFPELIITLASLFAIGIVLKLLTSWINNGMHSQHSGGSPHAWTWKNPGGSAEFDSVIESNKRAIAAADKEIAESERLLNE